MTATSAIDSTNTNVDTQSGAPVKILGKDDFLNLLVAQLQHQDPLNPASSTEFTAQLAQFSSLEQLSNINDNLKNMVQFQTTMTNSQAVSYIGKQITALGNTLQLKDGQPAKYHFELGANAALTAITVYDASGGFVRSFETGPLSFGRQSAVWDGMDKNGNPSPPGLYRFEIQAVDADNQGVDVTPLIRSMVTGVSFKDQTTHLITELQTIAIDDVIDVFEVVAQPDTAVSKAEINDNKPLNGGI